MKSFITGFVGNIAGAAAQFTGGLMLATGVNPGGVGNHLHKAGGEFAHGMQQRAGEIAHQEKLDAAEQEKRKHEERSVEIALAAAAEKARHDNALQQLG